jgi:hypothetical protein
MAWRMRHRGGSNIMDQEEYRFTIEIRNEQPIELVDLTNSLLSLADEYKRLLARSPEIVDTGETKLYVKEIRTGSIVTDLVAYAPYALPFVEHAKTIIAFGNYLKDVFNHFLGRGDVLPPMEKANYENITRIVEPIAKDHASQMNCQLVINGDIKPVIVIDSIQANAIQNGVRKKIEALKEPVAGIREQVLLYWYQARKDLKSQTGDKAVIESINPKPVKTIFVNEDIKTRVLFESQNPFKLAYIVDVAVETIDNKPVVYKILHVHESMETEIGTPR